MISSYILHMVGLSYKDYALSKCQIYRFLRTSIPMRTAFASFCIANRKNVRFIRSFPLNENDL